MTGAPCGSGRIRTVTNWPGSAAGSGLPSVAARVREKMLLLSGAMSVTTRGRKPGQAGGGLVAADVRPVLPPVLPVDRPFES